MDDRTAGRITNPSGTERLHEYWVHGEGAAKIRWGEPGDFDRCVLHLGKYIRDPKGYCNLAHHAALGIYPATHAKLIHAGRDVPVTDMEFRAPMTAQSINDLPDSAFAFIQEGGSKDSSGKTVPRSLRHFPIHDKAHADNAAARIAQGAKFGKEALPKVKAAQKKFGETDDSGGRAGIWPVERRYTKTVVGVVLTGGEETRDGMPMPRRIGGYAAKFKTYSRDLGHFVEEIEPYFFNKSKGDGWPEVLCRFNHEDSQLLGTTEARTLSLNTDMDGLLYDVEPPPSMRHVIEWVERGDVRKSSFAFRVPPGGDEWTLTEDGGPLRRLHTGRLVDVAPVVTPAYTDTSAGLRSFAEHFEADFEEVRSLAEAHELRKFFVRTDNRGPAPKPKVTGAAAMMRLMEKRFPSA